jgi:hypothetical protein
MIQAEWAMVTFAACNSARVLAYIPQIVSIARDQNGSPGVSCLTWAGFAAANFSTVAYALVVPRNWIMATVFGVNGLFCLAIVTLTAWKRFRSGSEPLHPAAVAREQTSRQQCRPQPGTHRTSAQTDSRDDRTVPPARPD